MKSFSRPVHIAPLAGFRILFGGMMLLSLLRFAARGWIEELYIRPVFHFTYTGFGWVTPPGVYTYALFVLCALSALMILLGWYYRLGAVLFFLSFTYIELMDKAYYLNHYYLVSLVAFLLIFLPAHRYASIDIRDGRIQARAQTPLWTVGSLRMLLCIVYVYAGLAKLNADWLLEALPLKIWLPARYNLPLAGRFADELWMAYLFSWAGALSDLFIWIFLLIRRTRPVTYIVVIGFHLATALFFPAIGMFPFIMIVSTLVFFDEKLHLRWLKYFSKRAAAQGICRPAGWIPGLFTVFFAVQLLFPLRYLLYPGHLFWTEQGYRFSWRVMLMEKAGSAQFVVKDPDTGRSWMPDNSLYLTPTQEKQMSFQPDMILQFAHFLGDQYAHREGIPRPEVYVTCYATLNARPSRLLIDPETDLYQEKDDFKHKKWITEWPDTRQGF